MGKEKEICGAVRAYFSVNRITMKMASEMLGVSPSSVTNQLSGRKFTANMADKYADAFGFNKDYLLFGRGALVSDLCTQEDDSPCSIPKLLDTIHSQQRTIEELVHKLA